MNVKLLVIALVLSYLCSSVACRPRLEENVSEHIKDSYSYVSESKIFQKRQVTNYNDVMSRWLQSSWSHTDPTST